jgi:predicted transcriptional regulator of viral defense system
MLDFNMMLQAGITLPKYLLDLQAGGRVTFTDREAVAALGVSRETFIKAAQRLRKEKRLANPRQGFYVAVPPQYLSWGSPPPEWYIDDLMRHEGRRYYVGLLKAAEYHGASHQAVMEFQVIADKQLPKIRAGRSLIAFYYRKDFEAVGEAIVDQKTDTGRMKISSPELTAFDLLRYAHAVGGIDAIATVLSELKDKISGAALGCLAEKSERALVQRLGYLLERLGSQELAGILYQRLLALKTLTWTDLEPQPLKGERLPPAERNERWLVRVQRVPEIDE